MGALPIQIEAKRELPDYLPARMVNEFTTKKCAEVKDELPAHSMN